MLTCSCHNLQEFDFGSHASVTNDTTSVNNAAADALQIMITDRRRNNQHLWPLFNDTTWYDVADIIALIPEPTITGRTGRHHEVAANVCKKEVALVQK